VPLGCGAEVRESLMKEATSGSNRDDVKGRQAREHCTLYACPVAELELLQKYYKGFVRILITYAPAAR
jgi:hypothetical protein